MKEDVDHTRLATGAAPGALLPPLTPARLRNWEELYAKRYPALLAEAESEEFKAGAAAVDHMWRDLFRHELVRRAFEPHRRPVFSKGVQVAEEHTYDSRMLLAVAAILFPDEFDRVRRLEVSGETTNTIQFVFHPGEDDEDTGEIEDGVFGELPPGPQPE